MKKILFTILALAAMAVSCTKFEQDPDIEFVAAPTPEVKAEPSVKEVGGKYEYSLKVSVKAKEGTTYYSYAVLAGPAAELDPSLLIAGKYKDQALVGADKQPLAAVVDFSKNPKGVTLDIKGVLQENTPYTVYAVATNAQGVPSEIATATALTADKTAPQIVQLDSQEKDKVLTVAIVFDDIVTLTGTGKVMARYFAINDFAKEGEPILNEKYEFEVKDVSVEGNVLYVSMPEDKYAPGALVTITFDEGIVQNGLKMKNAAEKELQVNRKELLDGKYKGILVQYKTVDFALSLADPSAAVPPAEGDGKEEPEEAKGPVSFTNPATLSMFSYAPKANVLAGMTTKAALKVKTVDYYGKTVTYNGNYLKVTDDGKVEVKLNAGEEVAKGSYVSYTIAAGSVEDVYGNKNLEFVVDNGYFYSYGHALADITKMFSVNAVVGGYQVTDPMTLVIEESDDEEKGNVMITTYFDEECTTPVYADFNTDLGQLTIADMQQFGTGTVNFGTAEKPNSLKVNLYHHSADSKATVLQMLEDKTLVNDTSGFGSYAISEDKKSEKFEFSIDAIEAKATASAN